MKKNSIDFKIKNKPRTVLEKFDKLKAKNKDLELLKNTFDLEILY